MQRVAIIGAPAVGKTSFSRSLSEATGLPVIHLDTYYHHKNYDTDKDVESWRKEVAGLVKKNEWIIEGNYTSALDLHVKNADTVIYLDYPSRIALKHIFKRRLEFRKKHRPEMPVTWKERIEPLFYWYILNFNRHERPAILEVLAKLGHKHDVFILKNPQETASYLATLLSAAG